MSKNEKMSKSVKTTEKEKKVRAVPIWMGILVFLLAFGAGIVSKFAIPPSWAKEYSVPWSDELGTRLIDIPYGDGEANKFDLYLPRDDSRGSYGLVVYLHAGGFTGGDKSGDVEMLSWLCKKGYVAVGINYTLFAELKALGHPPERCSYSSFSPFSISLFKVWIPPRLSSKNSFLRFG